MCGFRDALTVRTAELRPERLGMKNRKTSRPGQQEQKAAATPRPLEIHRRTLTSQVSVVNALSGTNRMTQNGFKTFGGHAARIGQINIDSVPGSSNHSFQRGPS